MKTSLKPADSRAWALLRKLETLADRGVDGEKASARKKLARLKARFDFTRPAPDDAPDLFAGRFRRSKKAMAVFSFESHELDVANSVKWAIESATRIPCIFRGGELLAEAEPATLKRLSHIAAHIAQCFRALISQFAAVDGLSTRDRCVFVMGLYDGMMNEKREAGQRLPSRAEPGRKKKIKKGTEPGHARKPMLDIHPYSIGLSLGKQIRFSAPLQHLSSELEMATRKQLS
ncbi:MAG TPA: hypothetical protein P5186_22725 [Candidatus Paceibacterota bacterium]|nr:hypothetical protein [Verrucomicrobiota bacterium]HRY50874.1 hypothetical protein [Candidatus Paceibacterota bacterium]HSA01063.1 hypothetical protein [Candidatus Paceibacterota bacterium]